MRLFRPLFIYSACALTLAAVAPRAAAQGSALTTASVLVVNTLDGRFDYYALGSQPQIHFDQGAITFITAEAEGYYAPQTVASFHFEDITGVDTPAADATGIEVTRLDSYRWQVSGQGLENVKIYSTDGSLRLNRRASESLVVDLSADAPGIYVMVINDSRTLKITR